MYNDLAKKFGQIGEVCQVNYPAAKIKGLPDAFYKECVQFEGGEQGVVIDLENDFAKVLLLGKKQIKIGERVAKTGKCLEIKLSNSVLGQIITPFGECISDPSLNYKNVENRQVDVAPPGLDVRSPIRSQLITGISIIDTLFPLGRGQRELVVGNRKTGKTSFLTTLLKGVSGPKTIVIYALIGSQKREALEIWEFAKEEKLENFLIMASFAGEPSAIMYFSPFCAMTYAEYFRDAGYDVVLVLDDLTVHAKYCREIALLARQLPGRDSYPPDIFYTHARILERAGSFVFGKITSSITCLPVAQTKENDFTDYIVSNLIGITDGHLLFDEDEFSKGRRPAINYLLSVTRVGRQVQNPLLVDIGRRVLSFLSSEYTKSIGLSYFGSELTDFVKDNLDKGAKLEGFFNEETFISIPIEVQMVFCAMILENYFKGENLLKMQYFKETFAENFRKNAVAKELVTKIAKALSYKDLISELLNYKLDLLEICRKVSR